MENKKKIIKEKVRQEARKVEKEIIRFRRHLHQNPELSFQEYNTSIFIAEQLSNWDILFEKNIAGTGIVAHLQGEASKVEEAPLLALRADIDALPIMEENTIDYASTSPGVMHACGHDVHTASLLGTIYILNQLRAYWTGNIRCLFQPGEEKLPGGASLMIKEGVLENPKPQAIFGQHVEPSIPAGKIGVCSGVFMASCDEIYIKVSGKGGHAARPHDVVDSVVIAAQLIVSLQQLVSRYANPLTPSVLSFGKIYSDGGATNVIPEAVFIVGTFRTFDEAWRKKAHQQMKNLAIELCRGMGGSCVFDIAVGYPFLKNEVDLTARFQKSAIAYLGAENVWTIPPRMGAEDFAHYSQVLPACFYRLGVQNTIGDVSIKGLHTPTFDIDERALETGMGLMAWSVIEELNYHLDEV